MANKSVKLDKSVKSMSVFDNDFDDGFDDPSLESLDPQERKFARRLRIQKRAEFLQKLAEDDANKIEETLTEKQIRTSSELLESFIREGLEVITNVRVANDAREIERQAQSKQTYERLTKHLDENTKECEKKYDVINVQWPIILKLHDPVEMNNAMQLQMKRCDEVLALKDTIIEEIKVELEKADNLYSEDQKKQKDDIKILIERIDNQMLSVENAYSRELELIEKTIKTERDILINNLQKQWEGFHRKEQEEHRIGDEKLKEIMSEYEEEMKQLRIEYEEEYRAQKIALDKECQNLEQEVEKTKTACLLNEEKLSYDYTILKIRQDENAIVKSQQKRKINKLTSILNTLKKEYSDLEINTRLEKEKLSKQILKAHRNILELEEKSNQFTRNNEKQYLDIWNMNTDNANKLVDKILTADRLIHERTLGIIWEPPELTVPKKEDLPSYCEAMSVIEKRKEEEAELYKMIECKKLDELSLEAPLERKVLSHILNQISNCSDYLIEEKLKQMILNCSEKEQTIVKLDNIFQALSLSTPEDINVLLNFFLPYSYCRICSEKEETIPSLSSTPSSSLKPCDCHLGDKEKKLIESVKEEIQLVSKNDEGESDEIESICSDKCVCNISLDKASESSGNEKSIEKKPFKFTCDKGHILEIQAIHVTKAIKDLVTAHIAVQNKNERPFEERLKEKKYTISRNISEEDVKKYWSQYRQIFGLDKQKLWDAVLIGLNKYYEVLQERHMICTEIENLKKQNTEIQRLLQFQEQCPENKTASIREKLSKSELAHKLKITI